MTRPTLSFLLAAALALAPAAVSAGDGPGTPPGHGGAEAGGGPLIPVTVDLKKVPVGTWAEYQLTVNDTLVKARFSLLGHEGAGHTIEMTVEGGPMAMVAGGKATFRLTTDGDLTKPGSVKKTAVQFGDGDPMETPIDPRAKFSKMDAKNLVGKETIKVIAGSFKTEHYRDKSADGGVSDYWVSSQAPPFGLVKMTMTAPAGSPMASPKPYTHELTALGKNGKAVITKPVKPFDQGAMMRAMMGGAMGGAAGGGGPGGPAAGARPVAPGGAAGGARPVAPGGPSPAGPAAGKK